MARVNDLDFSQFLLIWVLDQGIELMDRSGHCLMRKSSHSYEKKSTMAAFSNW
jgi:hypothetical protein